MAEFFCELLCEEIPASLQARGAVALTEMMLEAAVLLQARMTNHYWGPRRIAVAMQVESAVPARVSSERGPRIGAPEAALAGFLRKHGEAREALHQEGDFWVLEKNIPARAAADLIAEAMPRLLWRFPWPKSMRWGGTSQFTWIRPLRRITCLLDGAVVPFTLARGDDDGHGLASGNLTQGHRARGAAPLVVDGFAQWRDALHAAGVIADPAERVALVRAGVAEAARAQGVDIVEDEGLITEVAGLVEWPVALLGRIDDAFMDLPPEVMQVSMRVNQRYFATRAPDGRAAPWFVFVANIAAQDGGAAIIAGNERVLRARFSDARHFWDQDRRKRLQDRVADLEGVIFQAALGTQGARARRIERLAGSIANLLGADEALARRAGLLAKADLTTGMVGEFPELQGVMGGYYAVHDGEAPELCAAVRDHYMPRGPSDGVPTELVTVAVAMADKIDQLCGFFSIDKAPSGSGDPYGLRRAALGVIRLIRENNLRLNVRDIILRALEEQQPRLRLIPQSESSEPLPEQKTIGDIVGEVVSFLGERLRVQIKNENLPEDIIRAAFGTSENFLVRPFDIVKYVSLCSALAAFVTSEDGRNILAAYKRAANILRIEDRKDGPHGGLVDKTLLEEPAERALFAALQQAAEASVLLAEENFAAATAALACLRAPLDAFFAAVTVNAEDSALRQNRLKLLANLRDCLGEVADFSQIES